MARPTAAALAAEVARLAGAEPQPLALAVSGGPDSLALLRLGAEAFGPRAHVLSVDHGLRAGAAAECALVAQLAAGLGLPHATLTLALERGGDVQARAREARYAAMAGWCRARGIGLLATAHHADDQAETLLMRLARGSGLAGLSGIRRRMLLAGDPPIAVIRPLLDWRRADLAEVVAEAGWAAADDPSNRDPRFDRTGARALLAGTPWLDANRIATAAAHLAEAEEALDWAADRAVASRMTANGDKLLLDGEALPAELRRRLLLHGLKAMGADPDGPTLARLADRLHAGGTGTVGPVKAGTLPDGRWCLSKAAPRKSR